MNINTQELKKRAILRKKHIKINIAKNFKEAEDWDLEFWQKAGPAKRLSALKAIHNDIKAIRVK